MGMITAVKTVLGKYATFSGRADRGEFWWFIGFALLLFIVLGGIEGAILAPMLGYSAFDPDLGQPLQLLAALVLLLPTLALDVRRLHDIDRSGWWYLVGLIPVVGTFILLYWFLQPSTPGSNRFGPVPQAPATL